MDSKNKPTASFPEGTRETWEEAAREELQGGDPWQKLSRDIQGLSIRPYYSREDAPPSSIQLPVSTSGFLGPRTWYNCPRVRVHDAATANAEALDHLQQGADGIFFELTGPVDFERLLQGIEWPLCALHFQAENAGEASAKALAACIQRFEGTALGSWYGPAAELFPHGRQFHAHGLVIPASSTPVETAAEHLATLLDNGRQSQPVAIRTDVGTDFFVEIARLRAIRHVWTTLTKGNSALHLHACSLPWTPEAFAPHANMLKATTAAMSALLGGADSLTVDPESPDQPMQRRVARNVAILLREESRFAKVADPLAGSYFVDRLTSDLAEKIETAIRQRVHL